MKERLQEERLVNEANARVKREQTKLKLSQIQMRRSQVEEKKDPARPKPSPSALSKDKKQGEELLDGTHNKGGDEDII
jgi:hypothetical protein